MSPSAHDTVTARAVLEAARRVAAADDRGDAELARDDRRVAGAPATIRDDRRGALHHRLPVGIGHVGDQHIACLHAVHLRGRLHETHLALPYPLADRPSARKNLGLRLQAVTAQIAGAFARFHRFRPRLEDVELAVRAIAPPFDVHRPLVMLFDCNCVARELVRLLVGDREAIAIFGGDLHARCRRADARAFGVDHPHGLRAQCLAQDRRSTRREIGLVQVELVGVDGTLNDGLAESIRRRDEHDLIEPRFRIEREHHPRGAEIAAHHPLHACRKRDVRMRKSLMHPVGDRAIVIEARQTPL